MAQFTYRLQVVLEQKEEARKAAEAEATKRQQELESQLQALEGLKLRHDQLTQHRDDLRRRLFASTPAEVTLTGNDVTQRAEQVKVVGLQIEDAKAEIVAQRQFVEQCEARVEEAKRMVAEARREVEVLTKHRTRQEERFLRELRAKEELALDEIGNVLYATRRRSV